MKKKIFLALALVICLHSTAFAATQSLELTAEELVSLIDRIARTSSSWPTTDGVKKNLPAPEYSSNGEFAVRINPFAAITGSAEQKSRKMARYFVDLTLSDAETIAAFSSKTARGRAKEYGQMYGAVCAAVLLLNSDTVDEFSRANDACRKFFEVNDSSKSKNESLRLNRHVSLRFSYTNDAQPRLVKYRIEVFPTAKR